MITVNHNKRITTVRPGDSKFMLEDGLMICPRAGVEISNNCPREYRQIIAQCLDNGWLTPVANVYGKELTMDAMR